MRILFSPDMNFETDSFSVLLSAKNIAETGEYIIPPVALTDYIGYQKYTGWAVGYPLLLSAFFSIFGYGELLARWITILACSTVIPATAVMGNRLYGKGVGTVAALLVAVNPLLICLNGRILTANMGFCFLSSSLALLLLAVSRRRKDVEFLCAEELLNSGRHLALFSLSFLLYGLTFSMRDDYAMFGLVFLMFLGIIVNESVKKSENKLASNCLKLSGVAVIFFIIGYLPNIYFNYKTYGKLITSSHAEYGAGLSLEYFLKGSHGAIALPGLAVILLTVLIFAFPVISIFLIRTKTKSSTLIAAIILLLTIPIIFICGAFPVTSSGAGPRYIIPLVPLAMISSAMILSVKGIVPQIQKIIFLSVLILWHAVLFYPPTSVFKGFPKTAYLTQYSPWYNTHNYMNYPHPVKAALEWVKKNTSANAIILSDYDHYHYFYYAKRDVMNRGYVEEIGRQIGSRPILFIEDHQTAINPESLTKWATELNRYSIALNEKGSIPLFSPAKGLVKIKIYELTTID